MNTFLDHIIEMMKLVVQVGRKLTAVVWADACLATIAILQIIILKSEPTLAYWSIAGVTGFFFGFNILGDHIFGGKNEDGIKSVQGDKK